MRCSCFQLCCKWLPVLCWERHAGLQLRTVCARPCFPISARNPTQDLIEPCFSSVCFVRDWKENTCSRGICIINKTAGTHRFSSWHKEPLESLSPRLSGLLIAMHTNVSVEGGRTNCLYLKFVCQCETVSVCVRVRESVCEWPWHVANPLEEQDLTWWLQGQRAWLTLHAHLCVYNCLCFPRSSVYVPAMLCSVSVVCLCLWVSHLVQKLKLSSLCLSSLSLSTELQKTNKYLRFSTSHCVFDTLTTSTPIIIIQLQTVDSVTAQQC